MHTWKCQSMMVWPPKHIYYNEKCTWLINTQSFAPIISCIKISIGSRKFQRVLGGSNLATHVFNPRSNEQDVSFTNMLPQWCCSKDGCFIVLHIASSMIFYCPLWGQRSVLWLCSLLLSQDEILHFYYHIVFIWIYSSFFFF